MAGIDVMEAKRFRETYRGDNVYIVLSWDDDGKMYSVDINLSNEKVNHQHHTLSNIALIERLLSLAVRAYDLDYVAGECFDASWEPGHIAAILGNLIWEHRGKND